jgi:hypothetical protein
MAANPGQIAEHIRIPFSERSRLLKRETRFMKIVYEIEDRLTALSTKKA